VEVHLATEGLDEERFLRRTHNNQSPEDKVYRKVRAASVPCPKWLI
jgi:predicted NodU family carbamoyl transferase